MNADDFETWFGASYEHTYTLPSVFISAGFWIASPRAFQSLRYIYICDSEWRYNSEGLFQWLWSYTGTYILFVQAQLRVVHLFFVQQWNHEWTLKKKKNIRESQRAKMQEETNAAFARQSGGKVLSRWARSRQRKSQFFPAPHCMHGSTSGWWLVYIYSSAHSLDSRRRLIASIWKAIQPRVLYIYWMAIRLTRRIDRKSTNLVIFRLMLFYLDRSPCDVGLIFSD